MGRTTALNVGIALSLAVVAAVVALIVYTAAPDTIGVGTAPRDEDTQSAPDERQVEEREAVTDAQVSRPQREDTSSVQDAAAGVSDRVNDTSSPTEEPDEPLTLGTCAPIEITLPHDASRVLSASACLVTIDNDSHATGRFYHHSYRFRVDIPGNIIIDLRSDAFDAYLGLWRIYPDGRYVHVAENDDRDSCCDSRITAPLAAGTYDVIATTLEAEATGPYTLSIARQHLTEADDDQQEDINASTTEDVDQPSRAGACAPIEITLPYYTSGAISASACLYTMENDSHPTGRSYYHSYRFRVDIPGSIIIDLRSDAFDAYLGLWRTHPDGRYVHVAENDDGDFCCDSRITAPLAAGIYDIVATTWDAEATGSYTLSVDWQNPAETADQFDGSHGSPWSRSDADTLLQLAAGLTDRQQEVQLGRWFYQRLFRFPDSYVRRDADLGLIGYNYYHSNWPSSVCRDAAGGPLSHGWDAQPYDATPAGRQGVLDWRTRSWHRVYSVLPGEVVYVDLNLGDIGIFDGRNTVYYKHLNEIAPNFLNSSPDAPIPVQFGDYLGRMGMRGTAIAPHLTLEIRAGPPPHGLCPAEGTATSPLPYLYRLNGGQ